MREDILKDLYKRADRCVRGLEEIYRRTTGLDGRLYESILCMLDPGRDGFTSCTDRLAQAARDGGDLLPGNPSINTYPFGKKTSDVFPTFFGICAGKGKLRPALNALTTYCQRAGQALPADDLKTAVLLTDQWDGPLFQEAYESDFLCFALRYNIFILFVLVTDYGVTRIPFLAQDSSELEQLRGKGYTVERRKGCMIEQTLLISDDPWEFFARHKLTAICQKRMPGRPEDPSGPASGCYHINYEFNFADGTCMIRNLDDVPVQRFLRKKIPKRAAKKFARTVYEFYNLWNVEPLSYEAHTFQSGANDNGCVMLDLLDGAGVVSYKWPISTSPDTLEEPFATIAKAFEELITSLK